MKHASVALLSLSAVTASAQLAMPRVDTRPAYRSTVDALYGSVTSDAGNFSGYGISARLYFYGPYFVTASRNDVSYSGSSLKANQFVYGLGMTEAWGQGTVSATYAHGKASGDITAVTQDVFSVGYQLRLTQSLTAGFDVTHTANSGTTGLTTAIFSAKYEVSSGVSITASYAAADTLLGQSGAKHTWTLGAQYTF